MKYKNLEIIGTSHIAIQSIKEIENNINKKKPEIIALELDKQRFTQLFKKEKPIFTLKDIFKIGLRNYAVAKLISWAEEKMGKVVHTKPGDEMRMAVKLASEKHIKISFIDQNVNITLNKLTKNITFKEKLRFLGDIIKSVLFGKKELKKLGIKSLDLSKVPDPKLIKKLIKKVKTRYPTVYKILIDERDKFMAKKLIKLMKHTNKKILAVIGAGHKDHVLEIVKKNINKLDFI